MASKMTPPFVYINGYPGVGKLAVARALSALVNEAKIFDNHSLIDATSMVYERGEPEYQPLRKQMRRVVLDSIATSTSRKDNTWIFTDQQSSSENGSGAVKDYRRAAAEKGSPFVSVILQCELEENLRRLSGSGRGVHNTKLTDPDILRHIRETEDIYHVGDKLELEIDVTHKSAQEVAGMIKEFLAKIESGAVQMPEKFITERGFDDIEGFKHVFIRDVVQMKAGSEVNLLCWVGGRPRNHGRLVFCDVVDSTGKVQAVVDRVLVENASSAATLIPETALVLRGTVSHRKGRGSQSVAELAVTSFTVVSAATRFVTPAIRTTDTAILQPKAQDQLLKLRHIYQRNPILASLGQFRSDMFQSIRDWFHQHDFIDFSAPLITPSLLYDPSAAIHLGNLKHSRPLYLSQCAGFYLEAAAHAHERVYNLGPSFRNESRTNRHLMEYWHIKAELTSGTMDDIIDMVEIFLRDIHRATRRSGERTTQLLGTTYPELEFPFLRMTYEEAINKLHDVGGLDIEFGDNIGSYSEEWLTRDAGDVPIWITHKPKSLEPFPYCLCKDDQRLSMTADLIAPNGFGELCGVAEKSHDMEMLEERLLEKGKQNMLEEYGWVKDSRNFGMVPHTAFGMGFERLLRWLCGNQHVKDNIPFPRIFDRFPLP